MLTTEYMRIAYQEADSSAVRISLDPQVGPLPEGVGAGACQDGGPAGQAKGQEGSPSMRVAASRNITRPP